MEVAKNMDTIFADCSEEDLEFDVFFDQEDSLIDTVIGVKENGDPLTGTEFEELHQTDEDVDQKDIKDELGPDSEEYDMGNKDAEGTDEKKLDIDQELDSLNKNGESDADKELGLDKLDDEYQDGKANGKAPSDDEITDTIEKGIKECDDPECSCFMPDEEDRSDIDDELDPMSAPSADGTDKEQPVAGIPSDNGSVSEAAEADENVEDMIKHMESLGYTVVKKDSDDASEDLEDDEPAIDTAEDECGSSCNACDDIAMSSSNEIDAQELVAALARQGYKIVKADEPEVTTPVAENDDQIDYISGDSDVPEDDDIPEEDIPNEVEEAGGIDDQLDPNQDVAPEGDEDYNATDDATVKEETDIDAMLDDDDLDDEALEEVEDDETGSLDLDYDPSDEDLINIALK